MTNANSTVEDEKEKNTIGGEPNFMGPDREKSQRRQLGTKNKNMGFFLFPFFSPRRFERAVLSVFISFYRS